MTDAEMKTWLRDHGWEVTRVFPSGRVRLVGSEVAQCESLARAVELVKAHEARKGRKL